MHVITEVAVAGVDVLRVDGRRGLLNGKFIFTVSLAGPAVRALDKSDPTYGVGADEA